MEEKEKVMADILEEKGPPTFTKGQLLESRRFCAFRDLLTVLLQEDACYTIKQVEQKIRKFEKGEVK